MPSANHAWPAVGCIDCVCAQRKRLRHSRLGGRPPGQNGRHLDLRRVLARTQLALGRRHRLDFAGGQFTGHVRHANFGGGALRAPHGIMKNGPLALLFHTLVLAFMLAPLVVICLVAFTPSNTLQIPWGSYSLRWFAAVFAHSDLLQSFWNSLILAGLAATLSVMMTVPAAIAITRYNFVGKQWVQGLLMSPLIVPHLVLGVAMLRLFALMGAKGSFEWLTLAHVIIVTPYALRLMITALVGAEQNVEQAAASLGASRWVVFKRITLPLMWPGIAGGWILAFINSFDEVTMSVFITSPQTMTLPVRMYMLATESIDPMMAAVSALIIALTAVTMLALDRFYGLDKVLVGHK